MKKASLVIALAVVVALVGAVKAAPIVVDSGGGGDYTTIQAAITAATAGDTINVNAGVYDELISITKSVHLIGADPATTKITWTGAATGQMIMLGTNAGLDITGGVTIENFTIQPSIASMTDDKDLIKFRASGVGGQIVIRNNVFDGVDRDEGFKGIEESQGSSNFLIEGNTFENLGYGIWSNALDTGSIVENIFQDNRGGIGMNPSTEAARLAGDGSRNMTIAKNQITDGVYGLLLGDGLTNIDFLCNTLSGNTTGGIVHWDYRDGLWDDIVFNNNSIAGNTEGAVTYGSAGSGTLLPSATDMTNNWWGAADGPSGLYGGSGDSLWFTNAAYSPFLTAPPVCGDDGAAIPEPATLSLFGLGLAGLGAVRRRRR